MWDMDITGAVVTREEVAGEAEEIRVVVGRNDGSWSEEEDIGACTN